ncbi:DNA adenine methylase [Caldicellulosiruptor bescii]|uniref:site-specific DNA-methyltransferase (adenine-specific) n=3 Tax=Caldicellulosiruptor bescii TaxID=31899 RepID=B9MNH4_CALBD|nr:DNA adenine methylase [Caldicellulosiruptor bescii]ACM61505.1 D12 class N6 adenine-specific DNA methyltransferase [Caldicellulosiruptor bescii DSM 6725]PBC88684.1 DNA adenine methylase [Caldicellulosiruptor bescii]PBC91835.1 DNA adenine methylase [Caldicellulosiruptor bescii]PBD02754.1 DNA adenine methylase [Caldicellulosiruptor bescii]PBD07630.1 DNA adenine methylase [Caldicellulosiruptor bescii]
MLKNVLRYPGGKSKALKYILPNLPVGFREYREPMVGGGAVALAVKQLYTNVKIKINDLNYDLICFWKQLRDNPVQLIEEVSKIKENYKDGRKLYEFLTSQNGGGEFERAVRFYILNRITFSGTVDSGGYSQQSFENRFTWSAINKLKQAAEIIKDFEISHGDYEKLLFEPGNEVFIFLDPPYYSTTESRLYGKNGDLHLSFDHERFAFNIKKCPHLWMITYDDSPEVRKLFKFANIYEWELQYGMNNYKQSKAEKGKELFITNYKLEELRQKEKYALGL